MVGVCVMVGVRVCVGVDVTVEVRVTVADGVLVGDEVGVAEGVMDFVAVGFTTVSSLMAGVSQGGFAVQAGRSITMTISRQ